MTRSALSGFLAFLLLAFVVLLTATPGAAQQAVDLAGRTVRLDRPAQRVLLGEGRYLAALAILDGDRVLDRVAGTMGEFPLLDPAGYEQWTRRFPALAAVPLVGKAAPDSFSVERAIALKPDLAVFGLAGHGPGPQSKQVIAALEAAGIKVVFIDFFVDPIGNTARSIEVLGMLLDRKAAAGTFVAAYNAELKKVTDRVATLQARRAVFLENRVGLQDGCCASVGNALLGRMIEQAGGRNMAAGVIPGQIGTVSPEYLLTNQPAIYVGTAIGSTTSAKDTPQRIAMGPGVSRDLAQTSLRHSLKRTGIADLTAVQQGRAHAIWHHFFHSPLNVVALQVLARWFHPQVFTDLEPAETHRMLSEKFQPVPLEGTYWASLQ